MTVSVAVTCIMCSLLQPAQYLTTVATTTECYIHIHPTLLDVQAVNALFEQYWYVVNFVQTMNYNETHPSPPCEGGNETHPDPPYEGGSVS